jgi:hypothetical protein
LITTASLAIPFSTMRSASGAAITVAPTQTAARTLFALDHAHKVARRFDIQHFALVVSDHRRLLAAPSAGTACAGNHFFHTRQFVRQRLAPRMRLALARPPAREWLAHPFALGFGFHFIAGCAGFLLGQQFQLQAAQCFALGTQELDPQLPHLFQQRLDFQIRPVQFPFQIRDAELWIGRRSPGKFYSTRRYENVPDILRSNTVFFTPDAGTSCVPASV